MLYHSNITEVDFFERKRFSAENLPTYDDIMFIIKDFDIIEPSNIQDIKSQKVSLAIWQQIKKLAFFDEGQYDELKTLRRDVFNKKIEYKILLNNGQIYGFENFNYNGRTLKEALKEINITTYSSMYEYFVRGANIGTCGFSSKLIGVMFDREHISCQRGQISSFKGTPKSSNGSHAWICVLYGGEEYIVDTSLCLMIPKKYSEKLGYLPQREYSIELAISENSDEGDILFEHYSQQDISTKNKASYDLYRENKAKYLLKKKDNRDIDK